MKKLIKNYTTDIPVEKTTTEIQQILKQNGARGIALEFDENGNIKDIFFKIILNEKELPFRLPAKAESVYRVLKTIEHFMKMPPMVIKSGMVNNGKQKRRELRGGFVRHGLKRKSHLSI